MDLFARISAPQRIVIVGWLGACAGAIGAALDVLAAALLPLTAASVRLQVALACAVVGVLSGVVVAAALSATWELAAWLGRKLQAVLPRLPPRITRDVPLALLVFVPLEHDAAALLSGPSISRTALAHVGRWLFPLAGAVLAVAALRGGIVVLERVRRASLHARLLAFGACFSLAGLMLLAARLPQIEGYPTLQRYGSLGVLVAAVAGLSVSERICALSVFLVIPGTRFAPVLMLAMLGAPLFYLLPSSAARHAMASGTFVASPEVQAIRALADLDRDGYSPLLGGGDCNDLDASIHPFQRDPPGDHVDQDCDGVDGWWPEALDPEPAPAVDAHAVADLRARAHGLNVVIVLIDALRFDRLQEPRSAAWPRLGGLWDRSISFTRALSPASRTPLVIPAILDGHRGGPGDGLFRDLHAAGADAAYVSVDIVIDFLRLSRRLSTFADLVSVPTEGERSAWGGGVHVFTGGAITEAALGWIDARPGRHPGQRPPPWLLWVHYFSAHQWDTIDALAHIPGMPARYDAALGDDDRAVGELLDGLASRGLTDDTVVVLMADHGESLGDHGLRTHAQFLYPELVHVPMSILVPRVAPRSVLTYVSTTALTPTLLDLLDPPTNDAPEQDRTGTLLPLLAQLHPVRDVAPRPIVMQDTAQSAIALDDRFLRYTPADNVTELFSLDELDARHPVDLLTQEPETALRLTHLLVSGLQP